MISLLYATRWFIVYLIYMYWLKSSFLIGQQLTNDFDVHVRIQQEVF